ncbi:MAG TPA: hypothetical protein VGI22_19050 [Xanthobacteraceae bacterium]
MPGHSATLTLAGAVCLIANLNASALAADSSPPDFAPNPSAGWFAYTRQFIPPPGGPGPVRADRAHPGVSNDEFRATGKQPSIAVADLDNPILQPWARDKIRARNEAVLAGKQVFSLHASCWPVGVPAFLLSPMTRPMYIVQGPKEVVLILTSFNDVRRIYLSDKHSADLKPSPYGDSIGHYEGDTLVVDTIGLDDTTYMDGFDTPHTKQLHVVERFHLIEGGEVLEANVHVEDPGAFTMPWDAIQRFRRYELVARNAGSLTQLATPEEGPLTEAICAENPNSFMGMPHKPLPQATTPDF